MRCVSWGRPGGALVCDSNFIIMNKTKVTNTDRKHSFSETVTWFFVQSDMPAFNHIVLYDFFICFFSVCKAYLVVIYFPMQPKHYMKSKTTT